MAASDRVLFLMEGREHDWQEALALAELTGSLAPLVRNVELGLACERLAEERGLELDGGLLQATANAWRYEKNLISAEETEAWLGARGLAVEDLVGFLAQRLWRARLERDARPEAIEGEELDGLLWEEAVLSGAGDKLALALARRAVAASTTLFPTPLDPAAVAAERAKLAGRDLRYAAGKLEELLDREARYVRACGDLLSATALERELAARRLALLRLDFEAAAFPSAEAAREAALCATEDGESLELLARQAKGGYRTASALAEDLPGATASRLTSGRAGEVLGPHEEGGLHWVWRLTGKREPALDDPFVRERVAERLLAGRFDDLVARHVTWKIRPA